MVEKKEKRYVSDNAQLMAEWNWERNNELNFDPKTLTTGSHKKAWWKCTKGHEWQASVKQINNGSGCPYCAGVKVLSGVNDLQTVNPSLAKEWNYEKNNGLTPTDVMSNSGKKVWWKCDNGHEWSSSIYHRNRGNGCPYCSGVKVLSGVNDLQTVNPSLAKEWNYEKNNGLTPADVMSNSGKKFWWKCNKGHEWQASVCNRSKGAGCPVCNSERRTSFPEYAIVYYLAKYGLEPIHSHKENGYELDIYIPSKKVAIEYDGYYWHKNKTGKDLEKNKKCEKDGIRLYRIREGLPSLNDSSIDYIVQTNLKDLSKILKEILSEIIGITVDVDVVRDYIAIENLREYTEKHNSILFSNSEIAKEWNYEKNGNLKPENYTLNSGKKVWWKCSKGHEWQARIAERNRGNGCPYCSGRYAVKYKTDLQTLNPTLAKEWNYEKNCKLKPENYTSNSGKKVWWKCSKGHEWQATIHSRNSGIGCPYCAGRYSIKGENDLQTLNPALAKEWNYEKNSELTPMDISPNSSKKVWWKCSEGHEWQAIVSSRNNGHGCPYCSGRYVIKGKTDLQALNPTLAKEWNFEKNSELTPTEVSPNSGKKVWWKCIKGHEWQATIVSRKNGNGCPYCSGKYVVKGKNDLQSVNPKLAKEWNFEKNDRLKPNDVSPNSGKKVWWKCSKGHEWQAVVSNRNKGSGCPHCYKEKFFKDK